MLQFSELARADRKVAALLYPADVEAKFVHMWRSLVCLQEHDWLEPHPPRPPEFLLRRPRFTRWVFARGLLPSTNPSLTESMRSCMLKAALSRASGIADLVLDNPKAWLGNADHRIIAALPAHLRPRLKHFGESSRTTIRTSEDSSARRTFRATYHMAGLLRHV